MKPLAFLLALFILFLSVSPELVKDECSDDAFKTAQSEEPQKHNDCNNCSPFMCCHTCCGFIISNKPDFIILSESNSEFAELISSYNSFFTSEFSSSIWQPPKAA